MTAQEQIRTMTADEFLALPESNLPHELIDGVLYVPPAPELNHQSISFNVTLVLGNLNIGRVFYQPTDVRLDDEHVVQPDVLWLAPASQHKLTNGKYIDGAPDLVIEILSPSTTRRDRGDKFDLYQRHRVQEYWIVDPVALLVEIYVLDGENFSRGGLYGIGDTFESNLLNAYITVTEIFKNVNITE